MFNKKLSRRNFFKGAAALAATLGLPWTDVAEAAPPIASPAPGDLAALEQFEEYLADDIQPLALEDDTWSRPPQPVTSRIFGQDGWLSIGSESVELLSFALDITDDYGDQSAALFFSYFSHDEYGGRLPDLFFGPIGRCFYPVTFPIPNGPVLKAQGIFNEIDVPFSREGGPVVVSGEMELIDCCFANTDTL